MHAGFVRRMGFAAVTLALLMTGCAHTANAPGMAGIAPPPEWRGMRIADIPLPKDRRAVGLERNGAVIAMDPADILEEGDVIILRRAMARRDAP